MDRVTYLLEHAGTLRNLSNNILVKDSLSKHVQSSVLCLNTELLCFNVDLNVLQVADSPSLGFSSAYDPIAKLIVSTVAATVDFAVLVAFSEDELLLKVVRKLFSASLHCFFRNVNGPDIIFGSLILIDFLGFGVDATGELIIAASFHGEITVFGLGIVRVALARSGVAVAILLSLAVLFGLSAARLLLRLVLLALLGLIFQDEGAQLQAKVYVRALTACLAVEYDVAIFDVDVGFGVLALFAKDELGDEAIKVILELGSLVGAVDDPAIVAGIDVRLSAQLEAEVLDNVYALLVKAPLGDLEATDKKVGD